METEFKVSWYICDWDSEMMLFQLDSMYATWEEGVSRRPTESMQAIAVVVVAEFVLEVLLSPLQVPPTIYSCAVSYTIISIVSTPKIIDQ